MLVFERKEEVVPYQGLSRAGFTFTYIPPLASYALFGGTNGDSDVHLFSISTSFIIKLRARGVIFLHSDQRNLPVGNTTQQPSSVFKFLLRVDFLSAH
jgi:hypothetical protein